MTRRITSACVQRLAKLTCGSNMTRGHALPEWQRRRSIDELPLLSAPEVTTLCEVLSTSGRAAALDTRDKAGRSW